MAIPVSLFILSCYTLFSPSASSPDLHNTYIIHTPHTLMPAAFTHHLHWYSSILASSIPPTTAPHSRLLYTYQTAFHGFAARLSEHEAARLEALHGVVAVLPDTVYHLHTTRSPVFLGLDPETSSDVFTATIADHNVIVGVLDTGIWPESPSFRDKGMGPVPARWKGKCETGPGFSLANCNKKIIGARMFYHGYKASSGPVNDTGEFKSARDKDGHGTHTAATVAGSPVAGANLLGYAQGTARGMAIGARVAAYKVCWPGGCFSSDILAAVDTAVADGVDVLSISLGGSVSAYYRDSLSVASFGAMEMGVFVACSAGNGGPEPISLTNVSPWITTVGASTIDRDFPASILLGSGMNVTGVSLYKGRRNISKNKLYPLVYMSSNLSSPNPKSLCLEGALEPQAVAGKIVVCDRGISSRVQKGQVVKDAGGVGMILSNTALNGEELVADSHLLPAIAVGEIAGNVIKRYIQTSNQASATMEFQGTKLHIRPSPVVAAFSSRGPNFLTPEILKPDMVAPGVNVLAGWSGEASPSGLSMDRRRVQFNILSGTSMSCPHVAGVAALLKASHPEWSPAAVKSALMTTAYVQDNTLKPLKDAATGGASNAYGHGAGHISPTKALNPGLIYDISPVDYFEFLCTQKLTPLQLKVFSKTSNRTCKHALAFAGDLNYPTISAAFPINNSPLTVHRTVTNVGSPVSTYHFELTPLPGVLVEIKPSVLHFAGLNQKLHYQVTFRSKSPQPSPAFGALTWMDGSHSVRSQIVISWLHHEENLLQQHLVPKP